MTDFENKLQDLIPTGFNQRLYVAFPCRFFALRVRVEEAGFSDQNLKAKGQWKRFALENSRKSSSGADSEQ
jgi:hypothetical protein